MIYVTVGTQLSFDRLIGVVDGWAAESKESVLAQVGPTRSRFSHIEASSFYSPADAKSHFMRADLIVAHAGMGSILSALELGKPIIIFPRRFALGEHRNDHQMATAARFQGHSGVFVAYSEGELIELLNKRSSLLGGKVVSPFAPEDFIESIRKLIL